MRAGQRRSGVTVAGVVTKRCLGPGLLQEWQWKLTPAGTMRRARETSRSCVPLNGPVLPRPRRAALDLPTEVRAGAPSEPVPRVARQTRTWGHIDVVILNPEPEEKTAQQESAA